MAPVTNDHHLRASWDPLALAAALLAPATWGLTGVFVRLLHGVPALSIVAIRLMVAALVLIPWALRRTHHFPAVCRSPLTVAMGAYYIFATEAFSRAPVVEVTLLVGSAPVIAVALECVQGIRPVAQQVIGACVAVLGLAIFLHPGNQIGNERALGYLFALAAAAASAIYAVGLRAHARSQRPLDPVALTVMACLIGAVASCLLLGPRMLYSALPTLSPAQFLHLALLGIVSTAVPTLAFSVASVRLPAVVATSLGLMTPLFAAIFAGLMLEEWPAPAAVPGALVAIAGLIMVLRSPARPSRQA